MLEEIFRTFESDALSTLAEADKKNVQATQLILTTRFIFEDCNFPKSLLTGEKLAKPRPNCLPKLVKKVLNKCSRPVICNIILPACSDYCKSLTNQPYPHAY